MVPESDPGLLIVDQQAQEPASPVENKKNESGFDGFNRVIDVLDVDPVPEPEPELIVKEVIVKEKPNPLPVYSGTEYRVQIRARYGRQISKQELAKSYNLSPSDIMENNYNGYYIYTVGSYPT